MTDPAPNAAQPKSRRRWYQFGLRTLLLAIVLASLPLSWFGWQRHLQRLRIAEEADVREVVFRELLADSLDAHFERFLAFGWDDREPSLPIDPPEGYIDRLKDLGVKIRPGSLARLPKPGEKGADGLDRLVEDPATGVTGGIFSVEILGWIDDNTVMVKASEYRER